MSNDKHNYFEGMENQLEEYKSGEILEFDASCQIRVKYIGKDWEVIEIIGPYKIGKKIDSSTLAHKYPYPPR